MIKSTFSYLKLTAVVAVVAIAIIGLNGLVSRTTVAREKGTSPPREIGLTPQPRFSERAATLIAGETDTTTTTIPPEGCEFGGLTITALNLTKGTVDDKVEVGWDFTMPQQLASLGACATVDHFEVHVIIDYFGAGARKERTETASPLARNAVVRFSSVVLRPKNVGVYVKAHYKITAISSADKGKDF